MKEVKYYKNRVEVSIDDCPTHILHEGDEFQIRQVETGAIYQMAYDTYPCRYTYEDSDVPMQGNEEYAEYE